jgi:hypothetical protein
VAYFGVLARDRRSRYLDGPEEMDTCKIIRKDLMGVAERVGFEPSPIVETT